MKNKFLLSILLIALIACPLIAVCADNFGLDAAAPASLPKTSIPLFISQIIKAFLALTGLIFLILTVYGGAKYMLARGDINKAKEAREVIFNAVIGIVIVMGSYALASFIISAVTSAQ